MTIAPSLKTYLYNTRVDFSLIDHPRRPTTEAAARAANIPAHRTAKSVVVRHADGYAMAVLPATRHVNLPALQDLLHYRLGLASEDELAELFRDCDVGAVPPVGQVYGLKTVVDFQLDDSEPVWFEAGDHHTMVRVSGRDFCRLTRDMEYGDISCAPAD